MRSILRSVLAVIVGFVAASVVMTIVESLNGRVFYPALAQAVQGMTDREAIRAVLADAPAGAFLVVIVGWALGSFVGGLVTGSIARRARGATIALGALLTVAGVANHLMLPPPLWVWCVSLVVLFPAAYAGGTLGGRPRRPNQTAV